MCGKFTQMMSWRELHDLSELTTTSSGDIETVTPMRMASIIALDDDGKRVTKRMRWGFARLGAKSPAERPDHMHARAETIDSKPTFREAFAHRRGLLVVNTFNEGEEVTPSKTVQHTITPRDGKPIAIAVIWERWTHRNEGELLTFVMVTVPPNKLIARITDRMPAVIQPNDWSKWLGEEPATPEDLKALLQTVEGDWDMAVQAKPQKPPKRPKTTDAPDLF